MDVKETWISFIHDLQNRICSALEEVDGKATFFEDAWERPEGGGGKTRVIANGNVLEKGGVNTSIVFGDVTDAMKTQLKINGAKWFACGLSLVIHPLNPFVPTVHCNYRMFELYNENDEVIDRWFGGGTDLTPYYLFEEDAKHFHQTYKNACDASDPSFYPKFKKECDNYFVNWHRNAERRGIGGIFYDYQRATEQQDVTFWIELAKKCGNAFMDAYIPIVEKRKGTAYTADNKHWQEIRRGRYVEFNLVHDRGTLFGLKTNGRIESILMSLPPTVRFEYNYQPAFGTEEYKLQEACLHPRDWLNEISEEEKIAWAKRSNSC
ncbi:oxygen-dependent coproporphyrinogen oxidase [Lacibacter sediminis]|uniref:coproporphyrinogen oxidase n=1 Tax=Lacibacter sediminis TaxID=2760713 RepID=A0A7G5XF27_9BACT|nr:oxygen-dependent coproporphyrinogen oxidase [Lacibacter sediminis]QNA44080.1 oxygen-dependent coproporphyrinogen oxidase [Lacibacter sediminis]